MMPPAAAAAAPAPQAAAGGPIFGLMLPGRPFTADWKQIDAKKMVTEIVAPSAVHDIALTLLRPVCPAGTAVAVYYALPPYKGESCLAACHCLPLSFVSCISAHIELCCRLAVFWFGFK
jgi:hypothetical protein